MMVKVEYLEVVQDENQPVWTDWVEEYPNREMAEKMIVEYRGCSDRYGKKREVPVIFEARIIAVVNK